MPRRRMINHIRTDTLEKKIAHYWALGQYEASDAIKALARQIGAPIDLGAIEQEAKRRHKLYFKKQGGRRNVIRNRFVRQTENVR